MKLRKLIQFFLYITIVSVSFPILAANIDKTETFTLDNGLTVTAKFLPGSGLVAIQMWVRGGLLAEEKYLGSGISHFIEHMLFKGTEKRGPGVIAREIHELGGDINGATSMDYTQYKIILPKEHLGKGLDILADAVKNSSFSEEELAKEREVILKEINMGEDEPSRKLWKNLFREAFISHPYREPVIGRRDFFESLTREDIVSFYRSHYVPQHMVLAIAGDVDLDSIRAGAEEYFKDWKSESNFSSPAFYEPAQISPRKAVGYFPGEKAYLKLGFHIPGVESEELYSLDLLAFIIGRGKASRLYREIKEKKGLADTVSAFSYTPSNAGLFGIEAITEPEKIGDLEKSILDEIEKLKKEGVNGKELRRAKRIIESEYKLSQERVEAVADDIGYNKLILGEADFGKYYIERIGLVSEEEIKATARRFLREENLTTCILSPAGKEKKEKETAGEERNIHRHELRNETSDRISVILLTSGNRITHMASLNLLFRGGVICEDREKNGIFSLLSKCLIRSTKKKEYFELHSEIESRGGSLSSYSGYNSFGLSLTLPKEELERGMEIMASLVKEPLFKEEDIKKAKEELEAELKIEDDDVLQKAFYLFREAMFNGHPYAWRDKGTEENIRKITRRDIFSTYEKFCLGQAPVLAVFGDIDEKETVSLAGKKFGFLNKKGHALFKELISPEEIPSGKDITLPREQAILVFGFPGVSIKDEDRFPLEVITSALSGQSGRLYDAVREKRGQAYYVGAFQITGLVPGAIVFYAGTTSQNVDEVRELMEKEIGKLKEELLPESEIEKAKENLIGERRIALQSNSAFAFDSGLNELYGLGYNFYLSYEANIRKIDAQRIREIAHKYFNMEKMSCVIIRSGI